MAGIWVWCAAAWHLKDRDEVVGWDAVSRSERLKLVVQLGRFLVLEETRRPNLASQSLGLGLLKLAKQWELEHGYRPLLAESFSDPESHAGTVYKVTNWEQAGERSQFLPLYGRKTTELFAKPAKERYFCFPPVVWWLWV